MSTEAKASSIKARLSIYRGDIGMWSWVLHRITGVAIFFFLFVHVLDTAVIRLSPSTYDEVIKTYKNPLMGTGEILLVIALIYHAFNGIRVVLIDFWSQGPRHQKKMFWIVLVFWILVSIAMAVRLGSIIIRYLHHGG